MRLHDLPPGHDAVVSEVRDLQTGDAIACRLRELGFVPGENVRVVGHGPIGKDPLAVQIGYSRFALRRTEAARVVVTDGGERQ